MLWRIVESKEMLKMLLSPLSKSLNDDLKVPSGHIAMKDELMKLMLEAVILPVTSHKSFKFPSKDFIKLIIPSRKRLADNPCKILQNSIFGELNTLKFCNPEPKVRKQSKEIWN